MNAPETATEVAEIAADGVADGLHVVSEEALATEKAVRNIEAIQLAYFGLGLVAGAAVGGFIAYRVAYRKAETKYNNIAAEEIAEMREHYNEKATALEAQAGKGDLEEIVRERGYATDEEPEEEVETSATPPMAVTPPSAVVDRAQEVAESEDEAAGEPPDEPIAETPEPVTRNVFRDNEPPEDDWDWHKERAQRSPLRPYVIHRDEREENDAYDCVTFTYYDADDVVCNERDEVVPEEDRERILGESNLEKFGHGSDDASIVYIRNDQLEMDVEVVRSPNSFAEEVHGFEPPAEEIKHSDRRRGERTSFDDE
jgi:hypothetical protein